MHVPLLVSQPDMRRASLKNEDLILTEMLMAGDLRAGLDLFRAEPHLLRAAVLAVDLDDEREARDRGATRTPYSVLAFILLQDERLLADIAPVRNTFRPTR